MLLLSFLSISITSTKINIDFSFTFTGFLSSFCDKAFTIYNLNAFKYLKHTCKDFLSVFFLSLLQHIICSSYDPSFSFRHFIRFNFDFFFIVFARLFRFIFVFFFFAFIFNFLRFKNFFLVRLYNLCFINELFRFLNLLYIMNVFD